MKPKFLKLPIEVSYKDSSIKSGCEEKLEKAYNLGISAEKYCPECLGESEEEYHIKDVLIPIDDLKEVIYISEKEIQITRYSDMLNTPIKMSPKEFEEKLLQIAEIIC